LPHHACMYINPILTHPSSPQIVLTFLGCATFVLTQYHLSYTYMRFIFTCDIVVTQFFGLDLLLHWYMFPGLGYFTGMKSTHQRVCTACAACTAPSQVHMY
jgi:hypothetical protein